MTLYCFISYSYEVAGAQSVIACARTEEKESVGQQEQEEISALVKKMRGVI